MMDTADNPYVQRIFEMAGFITGKERIGVAISMIAVEAHLMAQHDKKFADHMNQRLGQGWYERPAGDNGSVETVVAFFQYMLAGGFKAAAPTPITLEA